MLDAIRHDVSYTLRALQRTPAFTAAAVLTLALGIGATTAIFSVVDAVMLRGLPFPESDRLVAVGDLDATADTPAALHLATPQDFLDWRDRQDVFTELAALGYGEVSLARAGDAPPENVRAQSVTADFFSVLRTPPLLGRSFTRDDERAGSGRIIVISHALWQRRFGGTPDVIGKTLPGLLASFEIVGVMPPGFSYPVDTYVLEAGTPVEAWLPYVFTADDRVRGNRYGRNLHVVGRLRDGVSIERAQAGMDRIRDGLAAETPRWFANRIVRVEPLHRFVTRGVERWMVLLLAAVSFVLLIACVNLANLMLVRTAARVRELGIRAALGGSRWDLARVLLIESVILSLAGAGLGIAVAWLGVDALRLAIPVDVPRAGSIVVDMRVLASMIGVAIASGIAVGMAPALAFSRPSVTQSLTRTRHTGTSGRGAGMLRSALVMAEVAIAVVLLVGSGLFLASFARVVDVDLGINRDDVLAVRVRVLERPVDIQEASERTRRRLFGVLERVQAIPGVEIASLLGGGGLPLSGDLQTDYFGIPGRELPSNTQVDFNQISPDYFRTLRVPLLRGRFFTDADDRAAQPVVILNEATARRYFPDEDAVGKVVRVAGLRTVVGVVGDIRHDGPESPWRTQAFVPLAQSRTLGATLVVRTAPGVDGILPAVRQAIWSEFPDSVPTRIDEHTLSGYFDGLVAQRRFNMLLLALFGILGLTIASIGIYGVTAYTVSQRVQEIGIRMALGAVPFRIAIATLGRSLAAVLSGIAIGMIGAWQLAGLTRAFLFEVQPHHPAIYASVVLALCVTGLAAAFLPARRAASIDPLVAIRME